MSKTATPRADAGQFRGHQRAGLLAAGGQNPLFLDVRAPYSPARPGVPS